VIRSFKGKDTQVLYENKCPPQWRAIRDVAERKLTQLEAAQTLEFLRSPPGNWL
jgi:proteic killer suppression protein